jgi:hypothetical protein
LAAAPALYAALDSSSSLAPDSYSDFNSAIRLDAPAKSSAASGSAAAAAPASAHEGSTRPFSSVGVGFKIGTGGIGFDVATPLVPGILNLRGGAGFFSYTGSFTASSDNINGTLKLDNAEVMGDVFPFRGSFRLSAGVTMYNKTALNGTISIASGQTLTNGNNKYYSDPANPLGGAAAFNFGTTAVPRFTLGWGNMVPKKGHLRFETEIGIEYIGNPTVAWNVTGYGCTTTTPAPAGATVCTGSNGSSTTWGPVAPSDIAAQQASLQSDVNGLKVYPILNFGLSYKIGR